MHRCCSVDGALTSVTKEMNIYACRVDPCMFYNEDWTFCMTAHADDLHATGGAAVTTELFQEMKQSILLKVHPLKAEGEPGLFLRKSPRRETRMLLTFINEDLVNNILEAFGRDICKAVTSPGMKSWTYQAGDEQPLDKPSADYFEDLWGRSCTSWRTSRTSNSQLSMKQGLGRCKHTNIKLLFLQQAVRDGLCHIHWVPAARNPADIMTQAL